MSPRAVVLEARALLRARLLPALLLAAAGGLYPLALPAGARSPALGPALAGAALALVLVRRAGAGPGRGGAHLLWIQKPGRAWVRAAERLAAAVLLLVPIHAAAVLMLTVGGTAPGSLRVGALAALALLDLAVVALAFLVSSLELPLESILSALAVVLLAGLGGDAVLAPETLGGWAPWLAAVRLPVLEIRAVQLWLDGGGPLPSLEVLARPLLFPALLVGAGLGAVELRDREPVRARRRRP